MQTLEHLKNLLKKMKRLQNKLETMHLTKYQQQD